VWEPCCGAGAITVVMQRRGYDVTSTDIADHGFGAPGVDFLSYQAVPEGLPGHRHQSALWRGQVARRPREVLHGTATTAAPGYVIFFRYHAGRFEVVNILEGASGC